ncbi:MAG: hypothetical protein JJ863_17850 [Deltaproteobacteria bacterium]|nr:hypothetical protein [Deltaproteobacteria bacterium]
MSVRLLLGATLLASISCSSQESCDQTPGGDGPYPTYDYCSEAAYPDFTHPRKRWDGTYPERCAGLTGEDAWACTEQLYWEVFQFDHDGRADAYRQLVPVVEAVEAAGDLDDRTLARLNLRVAQLGIAAIAESGETDLPVGQMQTLLERAHELDPDEIFIEAWLSTLLINGAIVLGQDLEPHIDHMWEMYERDPAITTPTLMAVLVGFPMETGMPDVAAEMVDRFDPEEACGDVCDWEFFRAEFGGAGMFFSSAEVYARVGNAEGARAQLELARAADHYDEWPLKSVVEDALADIDSFLAPFAARGDDEYVTDLLVTGTDAACMVCHAPLPE